MGFIRLNTAMDSWVECKIYDLISFLPLSLSLSLSPHLRMCFSNISLAVGGSDRDEEAKNI